MSTIPGIDEPKATSTLRHRPPTVCVLQVLSNPPVPLMPTDITHSCGASSGTSPAHLAAARELAKAFHAHGIQLVYGGGTYGVMGEIAKTLVSLSGPDAVHGVIPEALLRGERDDCRGEGVAGELQQSDQKGKQMPMQVKRVIDESVYGRITVVENMHTRKQMMAREVIESGSGGGFVALSGGYGTLEELMEVVTWNQLGIHERAVVLHNVEGYWDGIISWVKTAVREGFVSKSNESIMVEARTGEEVVKCLQDYQKSEGRFDLKWGQA